MRKKGCRQSGQRDKQTKEIRERLRKLRPAWEIDQPVS
jgi:hypothetical protein